MNLNHLSSDYISEAPGTDASAVEDLAVLKRVMEGSESALEELYQKYGVMLLTYVLHLVQDRHTAEDLIQEVFIAVWRSASRYRGQASVKTWLFKIAHYQAVSWLRRHVQPEQKASTEERVHPDPENQAMDSWLKVQIQAALAKLSPEHRAVVELTFYQGLSYSEIAEILDCPVGTVKSRMSYARRYLSETLRNANAEMSDRE